MSVPHSSPLQASARPTLSFTLRELREDDLPACHRLSLQYKWPHRLNDWEFLLAMGQGYVVESSQGGADQSIVATVVLTRYGAQHTAIGMLLVQPGLHGLGLGKRLMQTVADQLGNHFQMVNATAAGAPLYEKLGFKATDTLHQFQGQALPPVLVGLPPGERVRPLGKSDAERIPRLDALATGMDRSHVLAALMDISEGVALDGDGDMLGFALVRRFGHGRVIGPVVAPDADRAKALVAHWINTYSDSFVRIDAFESSGLVPWLNQIGLTPVDHVTRMSKGGQGAPAASGIRLFSIINQALG